MSKKHSRKMKSTRKRVPVSAAEEERYFQSKLAQLKEEMNSLEEHPTESKVIKKKSKSKEAINMAKKGKVKEEKVTKKAAAVVEETEGNVVTAKDLADALGLTPLLLRKKLRSAGMEKPEGGRWEWPEDHPDVDTILGWKGEGEEAEEKPAKKEKAKAEAPAKKGRGKKKVEPVVEEVEEEEEEEDDEEGIDLEAMTLAELRELCDEEGIEYKKKDKKPALIEKLLDSEEE